MTKAIRISKTGGPEVMEYVDVEVGEPGAGEVRIRHQACGVSLASSRARRQTSQMRIAGTSRIWL